MYEVCPRLGIVKIDTIDLSGEAKQTASTIHTSAPLFFQLFPVSELLYELTYSGNALRVIGNSQGRGPGLQESVSGTKLSENSDQI